ncbi:ADP-forming succinate--CoA ligase subunit beta [bacterium]|nr:ADP-forming succinate--CoA ligase subunit beta [bacterium]
MKIHEYQAKELFRNAGVAVPNGIPAFTVDEAVEAAKKLQAGGAKGFVVKAQIHAGGRGKGGGVKIAKTLEEVKPLAEKILGMNLVTHQTGPEGKLVQRLFIEEATPPKTEMYLSLILDRDRSCVSILASAEGGMDIEELAEKSPEKILTLPVDPGLGWQAFHSRKLASFLGLTLDMKSPSRMFQQLHNFMDRLYAMFVEKDCSILEINPLALVGEGADEKLMALDGKINFDSNALARHPDIQKLQDPSEEDPAELEAAKWDLNFISLDGNIGCMVNGAGLAMSTMDIIQHYGGEPANFLDVGGGATAEKVTEAFKLITKDPKVKAIFVNIFGGIMKCDTIAEGVIAATKQVGLTLPLVVRLEGTNVEKGREMLANSGLKITPATSMDDGAKKVVAAMKEGN